jgi:osmotically inducible protein OsmC
MEADRCLDEDQGAGCIVDHQQATTRIWKEYAMSTRTAKAEWTGTLKDGSGTMQIGSGEFEGEYTFGTRFQNLNGTNPEELIGAAHAGCYSMALAARLEQAGYNPESIKTSAEVELEEKDGSYQISRVRLHTKVNVRGIEPPQFREHVEQAAENCVVSKALAGVRLEVQAQMAG